MYKNNKTYFTILLGSARGIEFWALELSFYTYWQE